jgi:hypothetical protein
MQLASVIFPFFEHVHGITDLPKPIRYAQRGLPKKALCPRRTAGCDVEIDVKRRDLAADVPEPVYGEFVNYAAIGIWNKPRQWGRQA